MIAGSPDGIGIARRLGPEGFARAAVRVPECQFSRLLPTVLPLRCGMFRIVDPGCEQEVAAALSPHCKRERPVHLEVEPTLQRFREHRGGRRTGLGPFFVERKPRVMDNLAQLRGGHRDSGECLRVAQRPREPEPLQKWQDVTGTGEIDARQEERPSHLVESGAGQPGRVRPQPGDRVRRGDAGARYHGRQREPAISIG